MVTCEARGFKPSELATKASASDAVKASKLKLKHWLWLSDAETDLDVRLGIVPDIVVSSIHQDLIEDLVQSRPGQKTSQQTRQKPTHGGSKANFPGSLAPLRESNT